MQCLIRYSVIPVEDMEQSYMENIFLHFLSVDDYYCVDFDKAVLILDAILQKGLLYIGCSFCIVAIPKSSLLQRGEKNRLNQIDNHHQMFIIGTVCIHMYMVTSVIMGSYSTKKAIIASSHRLDVGPIHNYCATH